MQNIRGKKDCKQTLQKFVIGTYNDTTDLALHVPITNYCELFIDK